MEFVDDPFDSSTKVEEKVEPGSLLEQGWFFGNFLDKKTKMSRCYSDPCPSSNPTREMLVRKSYDHQNSSSASSKKKASSKEKGGILRLNKPNLRTNGLVRAPSLPPCIGKVEVDDEDDEESEFTMGRLIRQASLNLSDISPPPHTSKVIKQSYSIPRQHPRRKPEISETITNKIKSRDDLESEEVQGFKDLGFNFEKLDLNPGVVNIFPGLQDKGPGQGRFKPAHEEEEEEESRPYLSEACQVQSSAPPTLPNWAVDKKNSSKDMKAQIKFWARAVASNVRQEC